MELGESVGLAGGRGAAAGSTQGNNKVGENSGAEARPVVAGSLKEQLDRLLGIPAGSVIFDQLAHIVAEWSSLETQLAESYGDFLRLLVEEFARKPSGDQVLALAGRLIQSRRAAPARTLARVSVDEFATRLAEEPRMCVVLSALVDRLAGGSLPAAASPLAARDPDHVPVTGEDPPDRAGTELRVNNVYRRHLDQKRDEIDRLQDMLALKVREAISQNKEFGDLLQIERGALQQADSLEEVANLRHIVLGGIDELLKGQSVLADNLTSTSEYLRLIESDSDRLRAELHKVRLLSMTDEFTGLPNRRAFMRRLEDEVGRAQRYGTPLALAIMDLDGFKQVNDTFGHMAGDRILRCYADQILSTFRHHDMVARYGGEEFAVLLPNTVLEGAGRALSKVQAKAAQFICEHEGTELPLPTFSAGLTLYHAGEPMTVLLERADRALYRAKRLGRNRIEVDVGDRIGSETQAGGPPA